MEFLKISWDDSKRWDMVWSLYEESFPLAERRKLDDHKRTFADPQFHPLSVWENEQLLGIVFYWE